MGPVDTHRRALLRARLAVASIAVAVLAALVSTLWGGVAHAENVLVSSDPAEGATLESSPLTITLTFASPVGATNTVVAACNGNQVAIGNPQVSPDALTLTVAVVNPLPKGECNITYIVSAPDETPNGRATFSFTILNDPPAGAATTAAVDPAATATTASATTGGTVPATGTTAVTAAPVVDPAAAAGAAAADEPTDVDGPLGLFRMIGTLGLAALLGSLVLIAVAWPEGIEYILTVRFLRMAWFVALIGNAGAVVLLSAQVTGRSVGASLNPTTWTDLTDFTPGVAALVRLVATAASGWTVVRPERCVDQATQLPAFALPVVAVATYGFSRTGGDLALIGTIAGIGHALAMSVWLGGLLLLTRVVLAGPGEEDLVHAVRGYNRLSGPALIVTVLTGAVQIYRLDGGTLFDTGHGRLLLFKALVVGAMVFIGLMTRQFVNTAVRRTDVMTVPLASRLRRATGFEALGGVVVLALSAWLLALVPGGIDAANSDRTEYATSVPVASGDLEIEVSLTGGIGANGVRVTVTRPVTGLTELILTFIPPEGTQADSVRLTVPTALSGAGTAVLPESSGIPLAVPGTWTLRVNSTTPGNPQQIDRTFLVEAET